MLPAPRRSRQPVCVSGGHLGALGDVDGGAHAAGQVFADAILRRRIGVLNYRVTRQVIEFF